MSRSSGRVSMATGGEQWGDVVANLSAHPGLRPEELECGVEELEDYHDTELPASYFRQPGEPIKGLLNVVVINLSDIDMPTQSYRVRLELWVGWKLTEDETKRYIKSPSEWRPDTRLRPSLWTISVDDESMMRFATDRTTQVFIWRGQVIACECTLVTARILEAMQLEHFPFDVQVAIFFESLWQHLTFSVAIRNDCDQPLSLTSRGEIVASDIRSINGYENFDGRAMQDITLDPDGCAFNVRAFLLSLQDFKLHNVEMEIELVPKDVSFMHCSVRVSRNYFPIVVRVFFIIFFIIAMTTFVFAFPTEILGDRLAYTLTQFLTITAFLFVLTQQLPTLPYLTIVDRYVAGCFIYIFLVAVQVILIEVFDEEGTKLERSIFFINAGFVGACHVLFACYIAGVVHWERRKLHMTRRQVDRMYAKRNIKTTGGALQFIAHAASIPDADNVHAGGVRMSTSHGWLYDPSDYIPTVKVSNGVTDTDDDGTDDDEETEDDDGGEESEDDDAEVNPDDHDDDDDHDHDHDD